MELPVDYMGDVAFKAKVRNHELICDQPATNGGQDKGISPPEFLLASLGTCAAAYSGRRRRSGRYNANGD